MNGDRNHVADPFYPRLKGRVISTTGMAFYEDRDDDLARILGERFAARGVADCASYLDLLDADRDEFDALISELTIGETYFFRYKEQFDALRDIVLPDIIERNRKSKRLSVWSAGCSNGAEPYSLAIMLRQNFGMEIEGWNVSIVGTDINRKFLARASEGVFDEWSLRGMPEARRESYFARVGKRWRIAPEYRNWVSFQYHNLVDDPFPSLLHNLYSFDLILCRNVAIYFTAETFARLLSQFHESLNPKGWLVVGHSEPNTELFRAFRTVDAPGAVLYQKAPPRPVREAPPPPPPAPAPPLLPKLAAPLPPPPLAPEPKPAARVAEAPAPGPDALAEIRRLADQGRWAEAARLCRDLTQREPLNAAAHLYLALVLEQRNEIGPAEEALRRAIYTDRAMPMAHYHLGLMQQRRGDFAGARRSFRNALKLLDALPADGALPFADGVTAGELAGLVQMQINLMGAA